MANQGFRFFNNHVAETITLAGQYVLRHTESKIDEQLNVVFKTDGVKYHIYTDTDSIFFELGAVVEKYCSGKTNEEITKMLEKVAVDVLQSEVNKLVAECTDNMNVYENRIFFKLEKVASAGVFIAKKRYAVKVYSSEGVTYAKPKIAATGLDMVKSSTPLFIRNKLRSALELVFDSDESGVREYISSVRGEFDKLAVHEIAFPRGVSDLEKYADEKNIYKKGSGVGTPINARASLLYNSLIDKHDLVGKYPKITSGSKIRYVFLKIPNTLRENIIAFPADITLPSEFNLHRFIDRDLQWEKTMIASLQNILDAIGWTATEQSSLNDFFS